MLIAWVPLLIAIVGLLVYALSSNGKVAEIGRIAFFCGLFFTVAAVAGETVRLGSHVERAR